MEDKIRQGNLYDYYGDLLNDHRKQIYEDYVLMDLSLGEIAENHNISRQAVHDLIRRCTKEMESYEEKLSLIANDQKYKETLMKVLKLLEDDNVFESKKILNNLLEEL